MLTDSHTELEKIINNSTSGLKTELEIKEKNYNELLKELEIKDLHIKSLEKLLIQQNPDSMDNIITKNNDDYNMTFSNNFKKELNNTSFEKDDEREKELNKLVNNFNIKINDEIDNNNKIQPIAVFSNFEGKYDKDMNEELRNLARKTNEMSEDNINIGNNIILNQSLRNQILNNKNLNTNTSTQTNKSNGNKMTGKIFISKK